MELWLKKNDPNIVNDLYKKARSKSRNSKEFIEFATSIFDYWQKFYDTAVELDTRDKETSAELTRLRQQLAKPAPKALILIDALRRIADESHEELWQKDTASEALAAYDKATPDNGVEK